MTRFENTAENRLIQSKKYHKNKSKFDFYFFTENSNWDCKLNNYLCSL